MISQKIIEKHKAELPKRIFKYFEFGDSLKDTLTGKYFWHSKPRDFNDPFDCNLSLMKRPSFDIAKEFLLAENNFSRSKRREIERIINSNPQKAIESVIDGFETELDKYGICCFSAKENDPLMWAHYSKKHSGIMLTIEPLEDIQNLMVSKVNYKDEYNPVDYTVEFSTALLEFILIKHRAWEYEEEFRSFRTNSGKHHFNPKAIKAITLGLNFDNNNLKELTQILKENYPHIELYKSVFLKEKIKIVAERINWG